MARKGFWKHFFQQISQTTLYNVTKLSKLVSFYLRRLLAGVWDPNSFLNGRYWRVLTEIHTFEYFYLKFGMWVWICIRNLMGGVWHQNGMGLGPEFLLKYSFLTILKVLYCNCNQVGFTSFWSNMCIVNCLM